NWDGAEECFRSAVDGYPKAVGEEDADYATSVANLGLLYRDRKEYPRAEPLLRKAVDLRKQLFANAELGLSLNQLGWLYLYRSQWKEAEHCFRDALEAYRDVGEQTVGFGATLCNLGALYNAIEEFPTAEPYFRRGMPIIKKALGEKHKDYIDYFNRWMFSL